MPYQKQGKEAQQALIKQQANMNIAKALKGVVLQKLMNAESQNMVAKAIFVITKLGTQQFNVKQNMSDAQLSAFSIDFTQKHPFETIEDLIMMFKMARTGSFQKHYQMIDGVVLFQWFDEYLQRKDEHRLHIHREKKQEHNDEELPKEQQALRDKWVNKIKEDLKKKDPKKESTIRASDHDLKVAMGNLPALTNQELEGTFMQMNRTNHFGSWDDDMARINQELSKPKRKKPRA